MNQMKSNFDGYDAAKAVKQAIEKTFELHSRPEKICVSEQFAARGFVYLVKSAERFYVLTNKKDFNVALTIMRIEEKNDLVDYFYGIPFSYSEWDAGVAASGEYRWAYSLA